MASYSHSYDTLGHITNYDEISYTYSSTQKHAVTKLNGVLKFTYDPYGNMVQRIEGSATYNQAFDAENRLVSVAQVGGGTATFAYDAGGGRVKTIKASGATVYTPFPDHEEELDGAAVIRRSTYRLAGQLVAVRVSGDPVTANNGLFYYHTDHLGSTAVLTKGDGGAILSSSVARYYPFGAYRTAPTATVTDREYTGHRHNDDIGLIYMNARYYVGSIGRFASADTLVPDPAAPQSHNRYAYGFNNPVMFRDPTGYFSEEEITEYFGKETWEEVLALFQEGGLLEGRWGWLAVLQKAELGDYVSIKWDRALLPDDHIDIEDAFSGYFREGPEGELLIEGENTFIDQLQAAMYGQHYEMTHYGPDIGEMLAGGFLILAVDIFVGLPGFAAIPLSGYDPTVIKAVEALEVSVVLPVNYQGMRLIIEGSKSRAETVLSIPAIVGRWVLD